MVVGVMWVDFLVDLGGVIEKVICEGIIFEEFKWDFMLIVKECNWYGWIGEGSVCGEVWCVCIIYMMNLCIFYVVGCWV